MRSYKLRIRNILKLIENSYQTLKILLQRIVTSGNMFPDWKWLIGGDLIRGFTEFDMSPLSVSVSIFYCVPISFVLETDTEIDREFISNFKIITSENSYCA